MISKKCKYAIKALLYLADNQSEERSIFSTEIAENENIPQKFLETILRNYVIFNYCKVKEGKPEVINCLKNHLKLNWPS